MCALAALASSRIERDEAVDGLQRRGVRALLGGVPGLVGVVDLRVVRQREDVLTVLGELRVRAAQLRQRLARVRRQVGPAELGEAGVEVLDDARELVVALTELGQHVRARSALELRGARVEHLLEDERALVDQVGLDVVGGVERQQTAASRARSPTRSTLPRLAIATPPTTKVIASRTPMLASNLMVMVGRIESSRMSSLYSDVRRPNLI